MVVGVYSIGIVGIINSTAQDLKAEMTLLQGLARRHGLSLLRGRSG
jgi:hypothetical protein